jgi:Flp pilus assembly protein protease CpaA
MIAYFPNLIFGWTYLVILMAMLTVASYWDLRFMKIPKWISLTILLAGVLANLIRSGWLGAQEVKTWVLEPGGMGLGILDGLLFSLAGFAVGFSLFFLLWVLGVSGGGDVKLFTALSCWVGPVLILYVFAVTVVVVAMVVFFRLAYYVFSGRGFQVMRNRSRFTEGGRKPVKKPKGGDLGFSLPVAIACVVVLLWVFRGDLQLTSRVATDSPGNDARAELKHSS